MTGYNDILLSIVLVLVAVLVIFLIVVCIKLLYTFDKVNIILTDATKKMNSLNGVFNALDNVSSAVNGFTKRVSGVVASLFERITRKKDKEEN